MKKFEMGALVHIAMSEDERKAREAARHLVGWLVWLFAHQPTLPICAEAGIFTENVRRLADSPRPIFDLVTDNALSRFAVVGSPSHCREALAAIIEAGITHPILAVRRIDAPERDVRRVFAEVVSHFL